MDMESYLLEIIVFAVATLILTWVSRRSLLKPGSHGFYRYFAWECMSVMFVLDLRTWYEDVHAPHQTIAGGLFFTSLLLVLSGVNLLQRHGKVNRNRDDVPMFPFEKTTALVTNGVYRYIRHPIYASLFFLCWGFFFKHPSPVAAILGVTASTFLVATARVEENENINYFGDEYRQYMKRSKMFVPFLL
jgi:protein-S-isoprenylcysteine O-methyltransferase Ste14